MNETVKFRLDRMISSHQEQERLKLERQRLRECASARFTQAFRMRVKAVIVPSIREISAYLQEHWPLIDVEAEEAIEGGDAVLRVSLKSRSDRFLASTLGQPHLRFVGDARKRRVRIERGQQGPSICGGTGYRNDAQLHCVTPQLVQDLVADVLQNFFDPSSKI